ncbi:MAG: AraC family transcriptional regulator, partial [Planctomycetota bacterium]
FGMLNDYKLSDLHTPVRGIDWIGTLGNPVTKFQFCRRFAASTGDSPSESPMRLRVENARHRIASLAISAQDAGFSDQTHFFKRMHGITPGTYQRVHS